MAKAFYNEIDGYAAEWLRNLSDGGHIAQGEVDERSIRDVIADDLQGYFQHHFFAGIGGWSRALRLAGWPDDLPVWTGSCPCQPFSVAGRGKGFADERHLWPDWFRLIRLCRPPVVFGEQVASPPGRTWLDAVYADLEAAGYAVGAAVLPAAGVGAPHGRHRIYFVAVADGERFDGIYSLLRSGKSREDRAQAAGSGEAHSLVHATISRCGRSQKSGENSVDAKGSTKTLGWRSAGIFESERSGAFGTLGNSSLARGRGNAGAFFGEEASGEGGWKPTRDLAHVPLASGHDGWRDLEWLPCTDGKWRPTQPGLFPLAHGVSARVGRLRAYGNAIVPQVAASFITSAVQAICERKIEHG